MRLIGDKVEAVITRILGVILAALAAQFVIDGLKQSFPHVLALAGHPPHPERRSLRQRDRRQPAGTWPRCSWA